jgi:hypothetical protein
MLRRVLQTLDLIATLLHFRRARAPEKFFGEMQTEQEHAFAVCV